MRLCPFNGCKTMVSDTLFGCPHHWKMLPKALKDRVWESYSAYKKDQITVTELRAIQGEVVRAAEALPQFEDDRVTVRPAAPRPHYPGTVPGACSSCGQDVLWACMTKTGKRMPLDPDPDPDGNVVVTPDGALVLTKAMVEEHKKVKARRFKSHFATCPNADRHRKQK